jgi:signal peptidase I
VPEFQGPTASRAEEQPSDSGSRRVPWRAGLLSAVVAGLGQLYSGRPLRAIILHALSLSLGFVFLRMAFVAAAPWNILAVVVALLVVWLLILGDAVRCARIAPSPYRLKPYNRWYVYLLIFVAVGVEQHLFRTFVLYRFEHAYKLPVESMAPTLLPGDRILVDMHAYERENPCPGDIVVFRLPTDRSALFVKRVVAQGGDVVEIRDRRGYVNGRPLQEPYVRYSFPGQARAGDNFPPAQGEELPGATLSWGEEMQSYVQNGALVVPSGSYFVLGDNREESWDSRFWDFVPQSDILGKVGPVYFSWNERAHRVRWDRIGEILK